MDRPVLLICLLAAAACFAGAMLVDTPAWVSFFEHEDRTARQGGTVAQTTYDGVRLWQVMLAASGIALLVAPWGLRQRGAAVEHALPDRPRRIPFLVLAFVVVGTGLRLARIGESLWYDEIAAYREYGGHGLGAIIGNWYDPSNHVAHTVASHLSMAWLDGLLPTEWALRAPSFIASLLAVPALHALGVAAAGRRAGAIAAGLGAVAPVLVLEGVEARGYGMMIAGAALAAVALLRAVETRAPRWWLAYVGAAALTAWSHPVAGFALVGHAAWLTWRMVRRREREPAWPAVTAVALALTLTVTLYAPILPDMLMIRSTFSHESAATPGLLGIEGVHALFQLGGSWTWWAALPGWGMLAAGLVTLVRDERGRTVLAVTFLGGLAFAAFVVIGGTWFYARFVLFLVPGAIVLIAAGIDRALTVHRVAGVAAMALVVIPWVADLVTLPPKQPLRDAVDRVRAAADPGDRVLVVGLRHQVIEAYLPADEPAIVYSPFHGLDLPDDLAAAGPPPPRWCIVMYPESVSDESHHLLEWLGFELVAELDGWVDWTNGDVWIMERR